MSMFTAPLNWAKFLVSCTVKLFQVGKAVEELEERVIQEAMERMRQDERLAERVREVLLAGQVGRAEIRSEVSGFREHVDVRLDKMGGEFNALMRHLIPAPRGGSEDD